MRNPPPLSQLPKFPLTGGLCLLAIGVTVAWYTGHSIAPLTMSGLHFLDQPWRMFTAIFPHGGIFHLAFNIYWTWIFGTLLEKELGHLKLAVIVLLLAAGSGAAELAIFQGGVGLSGVGYGFFGMLWVMRRDPRFADAIDGRTIRAFIVWFFLCIGLTVTKVMPIANVAHGMGALLGAAIGWFLVAPARLRPLAAASVAGLLALVFLSATVLRTLVNLSPEAPTEYVNTACQQLDDGHPQAALKLLETATQFRYADGYGWYNKGVALQTLGEPAQALACYQEAVRRSPWEKHFKDALDAFSPH